MSERTVVVSGDDFKKFLRCLNILKETCNDVDIRGGVIRQRTNDTAGVFEINLSGILGDIDLPLLPIKQKIKLIEYFSDDVKIETTVDPEPTGKMIFSDSYSNIVFFKPDQSWIDNKFMSEADINNMFVLNPEDLVLECEIPKMILDRIRVTLQNFNADRITVLFNGEHANIFAKAKHDSAKFLDNLVTNRQVECRTTIVPIPFLVDNDSDLKLKMYNIGETSLQKFELTVDDVDVTIYSRSIIRTLEGE
jgi:hypothetical protein